MKKTIGEILRELRGNKTQEQISEELNVTKSSWAMYAQAWITSINPTDYLNLTTDEKSQNREVFDKFGSEWDPNINMGNYDYLGQLGKTVRQTPYLAIDINTGEVVGHDGRHRIRALEKEGIKSVEIMVEFREDGRLVKYEPNGERWETLNGVRLTNQFGTGQKVLIKNVIPLNEDHRGEIESTYGEMSTKDTNIKYSVNYWEPTLDRDEWRIINYVVDNHQGVELTEKTDCFFRQTKGKTVFGIYSTDDNTLLYAVHKNRAVKEHEFVTFVREVIKGENINRGNADDLDKVLNDFGLRRNLHFDDNGTAAKSRRYDGNAYVYFGAPRGNASRALQNVLENILEERESSRDTGVKLQEREEDLSERGILAKALESAAQGEIEAKNLKNYKRHLAEYG